MKNKLFSLINSGSIHFEPKSKIIPKNDIDVVLSAEEVMDHVKKDAETYRKDVIREIEEEKQKARLDGYNEGYKEWVEHIAKLEEEIVSVREEYEKIIVPVLMKAVKKIFGRELESKDDAIIDIVSTSLKAVSTHKKITIYVSPKEKGIIDANKAKLKSLFENLEAFVVREKSDLEPGSHIIETEGGIINARVDNQWNILEKAFEKLFQRKKDTE